MTRTIALLTDFGLDDPYVGQIKGALSKECPNTNIIDLSHGINPFCVTQGAFFLASSMKFFPANTIFIAVVDPGVGSNRKIIAAEFGSQIVIAPDNGIIELAEFKHKKSIIVTDLSNFSSKIDSSATFHGRDIFAPIACEILKGTPLEELGHKLPLRDVVRHGIKKPIWMEKSVEAVVLHKDKFGNLILNISEDENLPEKMYLPNSLLLSANDSNEVRSVACYADLQGQKTGIIKGSQGFYELAKNRGSASRMLGLKPADTLTLKWD